MRKVMIGGVESGWLSVTETFDSAGSDATSSRCAPVVSCESRRNVVSVNGRKPPRTPCKQPTQEIRRVVREGQSKKEKELLGRYKIYQGAEAGVKGSLGALMPLLLLLLLLHPTPHVSRCGLA